MDDGDSLIFSANLRLACDYYPSVSHVCRKLEINRQQFNSYLNGTRLPSRFNLKKISDFFGVEESEFFLETIRFQKLISGSRGDALKSATLLDAFSEVVGNNEELLSKYEGYYTIFCYSCAKPSYIIRSLMVVKRFNNQYFTKTIEKLNAPNTSLEERQFFKRKGILFSNTSRLFIADYEANINHTPAVTVLYPSGRNKVTNLSGVKLDISSGAFQRPFSARVVYRHEGNSPDLRALLRNTGLHAEDSPLIPAGILEMIKNQLTPGSFVLTANE